MKTLKTLITVAILFIIPVAIWSQNVGIGTTTPDSKLTVVDSVRNTINIKTIDNLKSTGIAFQNSGAAYSWNIFRKNNGPNDSDFIIAGGNKDTIIENLTERFKITSQGNTEIYGTTTLDSTTILNGDITSKGNAVFNENGQAKDFRIESLNKDTLFFVDGNTNNIGINNGSPSARLDVVGDTELNGDLITSGNATFNEDGETKIFRVESDTSQTMFFLNGNTNRIGINTGSPQFGIDVNTTSAFRDHFVFNPLKNPVDFIIKSPNQNFLFFADGSKDFVGIGTGNPSAELDIVGDLEVNGSSVFNENSAGNNFRIAGISKDTLFFVDALTDRIGLNTNSPSARLDVVGSTELNGSTTLNGTTTLNGSTTLNGFTTFEGNIKSRNGNALFNEDSDNKNFQINGTSTMNSLFYAEANTNRIGISTDSPSATLDVVGSTEFNGSISLNGDITLDGVINGDISSTGNVVFNDNSNNRDFRIEGTTKDTLFFVDGSQDRIGINTNSPSARLDVVGSTELNGSISLNGDITLDGVINGDISSTGNVVFNDNSLNRDFRIEGISIDTLFFVDGSQDRIGINTSSPSAKLDVVGSTKLNGNVDVIGNFETEGKLFFHHEQINNGTAWPIKIYNNSLTTFRGGLRIDDTGFLEMTNKANTASPNFARLSSSGSWTAVSDRRLKKNIFEANDLLAKTLQLNPVNYVFKSDENEENQLGFIAQDVQKVFPEFIEEGELLTLNYAGLSVVAIGAIKELNEKNNVLESRISELEAANDKLVSQVSDLTNMKEQIKKELLSEMSQNSFDNDSASKK